MAQHIRSLLEEEQKLTFNRRGLSRKDVVQLLLKDPDLVDLIPSIARRVKKPENQVKKRAERLLTEMASDYSPTFVKKCYRVFGWLWNRMYDDFHLDKDGLENLKSISQKYPVLLIPSHKSHMDYLLLSSIFYENQIPPPHIAAGVNLSFWPMGSVFRKNNAFFIRRQGGNDLLYARLLFIYIRWMLRNHHAQEFFIEGGRTRTGKMLSPKHGLLSFEIDAFLESTVEDLYVIPTSVMYDKVPEEISYLKELNGGKKQKENILEVWRSKHLLSRKHGAAYVRFGKPISLKEYFGISGEKKISTKEKKTKTVELAMDVSRQIAWETMITPVSLAAVALLMSSQSEIKRLVFEENFRFLEKYANQKKFPMATHVANLEQTVQFLEKHNWISLNQDMICVYVEKRLVLDFYKNSILHYFIPAALASLTDAPEKELLQSILEHEFFLPSKMDESNLDARWPKLVANYVEAYELGVEMVEKFPTQKIPLPDPIVLQGLELGMNLFKNKKLQCREAVSTAHIKSVFDFFNEKGLLTNSDEMNPFKQKLLSLKIKLQ